MRRRAAPAHPATDGGVSDFDYVTVGHVTVDIIEDGDEKALEERTHGERAHGKRRPGGGAFYSAVQAARLGLRTLILTKGRPQELEQLLEPYRGTIELRILPAEQTTTLATSGTGTKRRQRVIAWAGPMAEPIEVDTTILHLAPIARETPNQWRGRAEFIGITPQGLVRRWKDSDEQQISLVPIDPNDLPEHIDAVVVSDRERLLCEQAIGEMACSTPVIAVTAGGAPTTVVLPDGTAAQVPTPAVAQPRDDLGAGDVFAAAFFIALHDGLTPAEAAAYGNAAAAVRIASAGAQAIGDRAAVAGALRRR
jgi:sugar/nucleoside kinase (ribokinase family)